MALLPQHPTIKIETRTTKNKRDATKWISKRRANKTSFPPCVIKSVNRSLT